MTTTNIAALPDAQSFGWADAPFSRLAAGSVSFGGRLSLTGQSLTGSQADSLASLAATWNTTGTPTAFDLNVTETGAGSNAASLLMNLRVGGNSMFLVNKEAEVILTKFGGNGSAFIAGGPSLTNCRFYGGQYGVRMGSALGLQWASTAGNLNALDLALARDAANTLAQRNGANAQAFRLYNTFTDASNFERGFMQWSGNALQIGVDAPAGTGANRDLQLHTRNGSIDMFHGGSSWWRFNLGTSLRALQPTTDSVGDLGSTSNRVRQTHISAFHQLSESTAPAAPAVDNVRIYAEDNGSGKTRLMALFATGSAQQIAIEP